MKVTAQHFQILISKAVKFKNQAKDLSNENSFSLVIANIRL
jgi:hypothetical protein